MLAELRELLLAGRYRPQAVRRVHIPKPGRSGRTSPAGHSSGAGPRGADGGAAGARADLRGESFGFRPKRHAFQAMERIRAQVNARSEDPYEIAESLLRWSDVLTAVQLPTSRCRVRRAARKDRVHLSVPALIRRPAARVTRAPPRAGAATRPINCARVHASRPVSAPSCAASRSHRCAGSESPGAP